MLIMFRRMLTAALAAAFAAPPILAAPPAVVIPEPPRTAAPVEPVRPIEPLPPSFDPRAAGLDPQVLDLESLGLQIHLPAGAQVSATQGSSGQISVQDASTPATWSMRLQRVVMPEDSQAGAEQRIAGHLRRLDVSQTPYRVLRNEALELRGRPARLCYVEQRTPDFPGTDGEAQRYVAGWLVVPTGPAPADPTTPTFIEISILMLTDDYPAVAPLLDRSFATLGVHTAMEVSQARGERLAEGAAILKSLDRAALRQLVGMSRWHRIYRPSADGRDSELGFSRIEVTEAPRGALEPARSPSEYTGSERESGLLVTVQGRVVVSTTAEQYIDSIGLYWLAWDGDSEAWSVRTTHRQGERQQSESETGYRNRPEGREIVPRLAIVRSFGHTREREDHEWNVPDVYLPQALIWVVGRLLPRESGQPRDIAWYTWMPTSTALSMRQDRWEPVAGSTDWRLITRFPADREPTVAIHDHRGSLIRRLRPDGSVTEPISPERLRVMWRDLGMGGDSRLR